MVKFEVLPLLENCEVFPPVPYGLRSSVKKEFPRDQVELFVPFSKKFYRVAPIGSYVLISVFHSWEDQARSSIPCWINLLKRSFPWIAHGNGRSEASNKSVPLSGRPPSVLFSNWTPWTLTSVTSIHRVYWSRGRYVPQRPGNKIHHRSRF